MELEQIKGLLDLANLEDITAIKKSLCEAGKAASSGGGTPGISAAADSLS